MAALDRQQLYDLVINKLGSGSNIPASNHREVENAIIESMLDSDDIEAIVKAVSYNASYIWKDQTAQDETSLLPPSDGDRGLRLDTNEVWQWQSGLWILYGELDTIPDPVPQANKLIKTVSSNYTLTLTDFTILLDGNSNSVEITLPNSTDFDVPGLIYVFKAKDLSNSLTVITSGSDIFEDTSTVYTFSEIDELLYLQCDGINNKWIKLNSDVSSGGGSSVTTVGTDGDYATINLAIAGGNVDGNDLVLVSDVTEVSDTLLDRIVNINLNGFTLNMGDFKFTSVSNLEIRDGLMTSSLLNDLLVIENNQGRLQCYNVDFTFNNISNKNILNSGYIADFKGCKFNLPNFYTTIISTKLININNCVVNGGGVDCGLFINDATSQEGIVISNTKFTGTFKNELNFPTIKIQYTSSRLNNLESTATGFSITGRTENFECSNLIGTCEIHGAYGTFNNCEITELDTYFMSADKDLVFNNGIIETFVGGTSFFSAKIKLNKTRITTSFTTTPNIILKDCTIGYGAITLAHDNISVSGGNYEGITVTADNNRIDNCTIGSVLAGGKTITVNATADNTFISNCWTEDPIVNNGSDTRIINCNGSGNLLQENLSIYDSGNERIRLDPTGKLIFNVANIIDFNTIHTTYPNIVAGDRYSLVAASYDVLATGVNSIALGCTRDGNHGVTISGGNNIVMGSSHLNVAGSRNFIYGAGTGSGTPAFSFPDSNKIVWGYVSGTNDSYKKDFIYGKYTSDDCNFSINSPLSKNSGLLGTRSAGSAIITGSGFLALKPEQVIGVGDFLCIILTVDSDIQITIDRNSPSAAANQPIFIDDEVFKITSFGVKNIFRVDELGEIHNDSTASFNGIKQNISTKVANYTATKNDNTLLLDGSTSAVQITLPDSSTGLNGLIYVFKAKDITNTLTIVTSGTDTFEDATTTYTFTSVGETTHLQCDETNGKWVLINKIVI